MTHLATYYRLKSPTQTPEFAKRQEESKEVWGRPARGSDRPKVKAYIGKLLANAREIEFTTDIAPDPSTPPGQAYWSSSRPGVAVRVNENGEEFAILTRVDSGKSSTMNIIPTQDQLEDLGEATLATMPVAVIRWEPEELAPAKSLEFRSGFDDLDYVMFSMLSLPSNRSVTLVRHKNSPSSGIEICVCPNEPAVVEALLETIKLLNFSIEDLLWIHPQYESVIATSLKNFGVDSNSGEHFRRC